LRDVLSRFDCQRVPSILFDYCRFSEAYKSATLEEIGHALDADDDLIRLPQVVHVATGAAYSSDVLQMCDEERCVVAHTFTDANYTDASKVVWLAAEIDAKLEAGRTVLVVDNGENRNLSLSLRNLKGVTLMATREVNPYHLLGHKSVILSEAAAMKFSEALAK